MRCSPRSKTRSAPRRAWGRARRSPPRSRRGRPRETPAPKRPASDGARGRSRSPDLPCVIGGGVPVGVASRPVELDVAIAGLHHGHVESPQLSLELSTLRLGVSRDPCRFGRRGRPALTPRSENSDGEKRESDPGLAPCPFPRRHALALPVRALFARPPPPALARRGSRPSTISQWSSCTSARSAARTRRPLGVMR